MTPREVVTSDMLGNVLWAPSGVAVAHRSFSKSS